jgi:predicted anti-sigma-YlaC factor YlaD
MNWMYSCRRIAELVSRRLDEPLDVADRLLLRVHLAMCGNCRNVERQLVEINAIAERVLSGDSAAAIIESGPETEPGS